MDLHLKQWKNQQQHESDSDQPCAKSPRLLPFDTHQLQQQQQPPSDYSPAAAALPFFVPQLTSNLSAFPPDHHSTTTTTASRSFPRMGSYFSLGQRQELELQALIFRHMLAGAAVPPELLHLLSKTLLNTSTTTTSLPPYYLHYPPHHYQPPLLQSGYWGRAAMDPEPGRCRRTDGKKWRCSRDVVVGHKYCERHVHRGRSRSRKPVEIPTPTTAAGGGGGLLNTTTLIPATMAAGTHLALSGPSPSMDLPHLNQRLSMPRTENKYSFEHQHEISGDANSGNQVLRHFFDDWPRSIKEPGNTETTHASPATSATSLSISISANPPSDFSLKLSTGNRDEPGPQDRNAEQERPQFINWSAGWDANRVAPMGGPLGEALRSSNSSPTSVLNQLPRGSTSDTSFIST